MPVDLGRLRDDVADKGWEQWLERTGPKLVQAARDEAPVVTGRLRARTRLRRLPDRRARLISETPYASWVILGRGEVRPKKAKVLRWVAKSGAIVFATRSGPSKPNDYLVRACRKLGLKVRR